MSIQLQVFPQWYDGILNPPTLPAPEEVTSPCATNRTTANSALTLGTYSTLAVNAINKRLRSFVPFFE